MLAFITNFDKIKFQTKKIFNSKHSKLSNKKFTLCDIQ